MCGLAWAGTGEIRSPAHFETRELKAVAEPGQAVLELCYNYTNRGDLPLIVREFEQTCGCMEGEWDGVPVEPGEQGRITSRFLTRGLRGTVRKSLRVRFLESGSVKLVAEVTIPEIVSYSAKALRWEVGEEARPKEVDIAISERVPVRVLSVSANHPMFSCELVPLQEARSYRIIVTPRDTAAPRICVLQVRTDSKDPRDALKGLFAVVEKPKAGGDAS